MPDETNVQPPVQPTQANDPQQGAGSTETVEQWKAKYDGLMGTAKQRQTNIEKLAAEVADLRTKYETDTLTLKEQLDLRTKAFADLEGQHKDVSSKYTTLNQSVEIGKRVRNEFPNLSPLYDDGLIRVDGLEGEALTAHLKQLNDKLVAITDAKRSNAAAGSTPPPAPASDAAGDSVEALGKQLSAAATTYGQRSPQYQDLLSQYTAALRQVK